jgi:hypothetical protein
VAEQGYRGLIDGKRRVVPGFLNKVITLITPLVPRRLLLSVVDRRQRRRHPSPARST